jgi:hypothetical protein
MALAMREGGKMETGHVMVVFDGITNAQPNTAEEKKLKEW